MHNRHFIRQRFAFAEPQISSGDLTHGQRFILQILDMTTENPSFNNLGFILETPADISSDVVVSHLMMLLKDHESLRTVFRKQGDQWYQCVLLTGSIEIDVVDTTIGEDAAKALHDKLINKPFGLSDLPARYGLVRTRGRVSHIVGVLSHMAIDGVGLTVLRSRITEALKSVGEKRVRLPKLGRQPVEQSIWEGSDIGARKELLTLKRWTNVISKFPATMFEERAGESASSNCWYELDFNSQKLGDCIVYTANKYKVSEATVSIAALSFGLTRLANKDCLATLLCTANRLDPQISESVGTFAQDVPIYLRPYDDDFPGYLNRVQSHLIEAYRHGTADPQKLYEIANSFNAVNINSRINVYFRKASKQYHYKGILDLKKIGEDISRDNYPASRDKVVWRCGVSHGHLAIYVRSYSPERVFVVMNEKYFSKADVVSALTYMERHLALHVANGLLGPRAKPS